MRKLKQLLACTSSLVLASFNTQASCVPANCNTLGYTKSAADCDGSDMIKCPFDTDKVWCMDVSVEPKPGMILYSDGTVSNDVISGKTPVGVVVYVKGTTRLAFALEETTAYFATGYEDVSCLTNYSSSSSATKDLNGATNTSCMVNYNGSYSYPAAEYCNTYKPVSDGTGSSGWYLPAAGELYYSSFIVYETINSTLQKLSKTQLGSNYYWSSSEDSYNYAWGVNLSDGTMRYNYKNRSTYARVRCVLTF